LIIRRVWLNSSLLACKQKPLEPFLEIQRAFYPKLYRRPQKSGEPTLQDGRLESNKLRFVASGALRLSEQRNQLVSFVQLFFLTIVASVGCLPLCRGFLFQRGEDASKIVSVVAGGSVCRRVR